MSEIKRYYVKEYGDMVPASDHDTLIAERDRTIGELGKALAAALDHQIANADTKHEFYKCYTYPTGELPEWVMLARTVLKSNQPRG